MYLSNVIVIIGLFILQVKAMIIKRSNAVGMEKLPMEIDYQANKKFVPFQRWREPVGMEDANVSMMDDEQVLASLAYKTSHRTALDLDQIDQGVNGRQNTPRTGLRNPPQQRRRYRQNHLVKNPTLVVPMMKQQVEVEKQQEEIVSKPLPKRKQKNMIGVDGLGHMRHMVLDSNKDDGGEIRLNEKNVVALDTIGELHTMILPTTSQSKGKKY
ncbi:uncharacterized protein BX664DRAFT_328349 [Halteromyces radiatus]|uniref:uncharacterized protein n=1 Tax=Halteromyces radiatus TaxID=101107 RepID=UPI00221F9687|nr:uncharacterized protein BX664DRAFT_328349 [Halteromyces radiatus]KAI8092870.1 hypothetical protein BX664DRAFT_328349 [Halteromyces radiatus]